MVKRSRTKGTAGEDLEQQLLLSPHTSVTCPKCEHEFSLEDGFAQKALDQLEASSRDVLVSVEERVRKETDERAKTILSERDKVSKQEISDLKALLDEQAKQNLVSLKTALATERKAAAGRAAELQKSIDDRDATVAGMRQREAALEARERNLQEAITLQATAKATELFAIERASLETQLNSSRAQVGELRAQEVSLREERVRLTDEKAALMLEVRRQVDAEVEQRLGAVRSQEQQRSDLEKADLQKKLDDVNAKLVEAQRKAEQGSGQLHGEVMELAIEEGLHRAFPLDAIEEVKKGVRGGDIVQKVKTRAGQQAGTILWESKRAKEWSPQWIPKLREDMRGSGAEIGVLVTTATAVPKDWAFGNLFALYDGVWITMWSTALQIAEILRSGLLDVHQQRMISAGKGEKMEAVYDYLTSPQFAQKMRAVYEAFKKLKTDNDEERLRAEQRWARRDKQIQVAVLELVGIGGEIQGLAQQDVAMLELDASVAKEEATKGDVG